MVFTYTRKAQNSLETCDTRQRSRAKLGGALNESVRATFLFATPSWQEGVGRLVDFANTLTEYNRTGQPDDPDVRAAAQDWLAVGDELGAAVSKLPR